MSDLKSESPGEEQWMTDEWKRKLARFKNGTPAGAPTVYVGEKVAVPIAAPVSITSPAPMAAPTIIAAKAPVAAAAPAPIAWKMEVPAPSAAFAIPPMDKKTMEIYSVGRGAAAIPVAAPGATAAAATVGSLRPGQQILDAEEIKKLEEAAAQKIVDRYKHVNGALKLMLEYQKHNQQNKTGVDGMRMLDATQKKMVCDAIMLVADHNPAMAIQVARLMYTLVDLNHRSQDALFYAGCAHMHNGTLVDAICNWCTAVKAEPPPSQAKSGKLQRKKMVVDGKVVQVDSIKNYGEKSNDFWFRHVRSSIYNTCRDMVHQIGARLKPTVANVSAMEKLFKINYTGLWKTPRGLPQHYHIFNPCLRRHPTKPGKFLVNLRAANYFMKRVDKNDGSHTYCYVDHKGDEHQPFRTLNYLTVIDEDSIQDTFRAANVTQMIVPQVPYPHNIGGYEDVRLLWNDEDKTMWITFTSLELSKEHTIRICVARLDVDTCKVIPGTSVVLPSFDANRQEKNWMGFFYHGNLCLVYEMFPTVTVLRANLEFVDNKPGPKYGETTVVSMDMCLKPNVYRGSSPLMDLPKTAETKAENARLFMDHQPDDRYYLAILHVSDYPRYSNVFAMFRLRPSQHSLMRPFACHLMAVTPMFFFRELDVEFTCGMDFTTSGEEICVPNATRDQICYFTRFDTQSVMNQLQKVDDVSQLNLRKHLDLF